jgi:antitoxin MazE
VYTQCRYMEAFGRMTTWVAKWGNSLSLRLPKAVAQAVQIEEGDQVEITVQEGAIVVRPSKPTFTLRELVGKITPANRHKEIDWGRPAGRESW